MSETPLKVALEQNRRARLSLLATNAEQSLYAKFGFRSRYPVYQCQGVVHQKAVAKVLPALRIRRIELSDLEVLPHLDAPYHELDREVWRRELLRYANGIIALQGNQPVGYALVSASDKGTLIGPVMADGAPVAQALILRLLAKATGSLRIDIPEPAAALVPWIAAFGLADVSRGIYMTYGETTRTSSASTCYGLAPQVIAKSLGRGSL